MALKKDTINKLDVLIHELMIFSRLLEIYTDDSEISQIYHEFLNDRLSYYSNVVAKVNSILAGDV